MNYRYLNAPEEPGFARVLDIYHAAFERDSREPDERLVAELRGEFRLPFHFLVVEEDGQVQGFARFCEIPNSPYGFLIHIAMDEASRGSGHGSRLLQRVIEELDPRPMLVEIDREGPVRRWYDRLGFCSLTETYTQPSLHDDTPSVPYALCASRPLVDAVDAVESFYSNVWELDPGHPFVRDAVAGVKL